ncbi:MAG: hypothetical protein SFV32_09960 [Opitutaceae bacterium]|nr:hypothetical protein [Opitutaceae bacterium]
MRLPAILLFTLLSGGATSIAEVAPSVGLQVENAPVANEEMVRAVALAMQDFASEIPQTVRMTAAARFLGELYASNPSLSRATNLADLALGQRKSALLKALARESKASGAEASLDGLATARVQAILEAAALSPSTQEEASRVLGEIRLTSSVYHRRLREGRMEDEDLLSMVRRIKNGRQERSVGAAAREDSAASLLSEFSRNNQQGAAVARLRTYVVDCELKTSSGVNQRLVIARQRPDRFRLHVYEGGTLQMVLAGDRDRLERWTRGTSVAKFPQNDPGAAEFLVTFIEPLLEPEQFTVKKEGEEKVAGTEAVKLSLVDGRDGRRSTVWVDKADFRLLKRVNHEGTTMMYSDFRDEGGVRWPHKVETSDSRNRSSELIVKRIVANPGLVSDLFEIGDTPAFDVFAFDSAMTLARTKPVSTTSK